MQKKNLIVSWLVSFVLLIALVVSLAKDFGREDDTATEAVRQRIEYFSGNYFRFLEDVQIETDADTEKIAVSVSFIPETGSFPVKEDIYQSAAYHALEIVSFFPEVNQFHYVVLWEKPEKEEVLTMTIDEDAIKSLSDNYFNEYINQNAGFDTHYKNIFSTVIETEESETWRERVDSNADIP